jgi:hypothetical protein
VVVEEKNAEARLLHLLPHHLHLVCVRFLLLILFPYQGPLAAKMRG